VGFWFIGKLRSTGLGTSDPMEDSYLCGIFKVQAKGSTFSEDKTLDVVREGNLLLVSSYKVSIVLKHIYELDNAA
jgi:hypothetical protein